MGDIESTVSIRGLAEWLVRDYLTALGARPDPRAPAAPQMVGEGWRVSWTHHAVQIAGSALTLTQFDLVFAGEADAVARVQREFMRKAQRGGG